MDSRHVTSSKKTFHDEGQCESDRENHQEILDSRRYLGRPGRGLDRYQPAYPKARVIKRSRDFNARIL
jgi:hypothetical protein